jgi:hypothetical protein
MALGTRSDPAPVSGFAKKSWDAKNFDRPFAAPGENASNFVATM